MRTIILILLLPLHVVPAYADDFEQYFEMFGIDKNASFSGTRRLESKEGQIDSFVRQAGEKMRMEMNFGDMSSVVIVRPDLGKNFMLMPTMGMYRELDTKALQEAGSADFDFSEASEIGREAINGYDCTKYKTKFKDKQGGKGGGYYWVSDDGIIMKVDMIFQNRKQKGQRMVLEMLELEIGPQDPSEFEVPDNYSKMGLGGMLGRMGQNPQARANGGQQNEEPDFGEQVGDAAEEDEAEGAVVDKARNSVRKGLGKLFGN